MPQGGWGEVPVLANSTIINIADALALWTNRQLKPTMHRISWDNLPLDRDCFTVAYFVNLNLGTFSSSRFELQKLSGFRVRGRTISTAIQRT